MLGCFEVFLPGGKTNKQPKKKETHYLYFISNLKEPLF